jgi:hypothetical protein
LRRQKSVPFFYFSLFKIIAFINFSISKVAFGNIECEEDLAKLAQIESQKTDSLDLDELIRVFNRPLKNQEDLDVLVKSLEILDSEAGDMIRKARNAGVQIKIGNKSHVQRDFNQILNRSTSFAKSVIIARDSKTSLFEIIHEIRHAIPHPEGGVALNLDPKTQSVEHMEESLLRHFYLDEAHSIEAEIKFMQSLESLGLDFNYDAIRPGVRNVYQQEGVQGVADNLPLLVPNYEKHYKKLSRALVGELVNPSTSTRNKSWSYAGVEIKSSPDRIELSLDSRRLLESISDTQHPLAQLIAPLIEKAKAAFKKISESDLNANAKLTEKKTDREILKKIKFNPREEPTEKLAVIESQAQQNIERVKIAAHFLDILEQQVAAGITEGDHFYDYLSVAETSYGHRSSEIYQKLLDDVLKDTGKAVDEKTYKKRRDLGYSLIRSGYKKEGRIILSNVIDEHLSSETVLDFGMPLFSELIKLDEISLAMKIIPYLETRLKNAINAHQRYELSKIRDYEGHYTKRGKIRVELFLAENNNRLVSYKEIREFRQKLYREGDLVLKQDISHLIRENAFNSEDNYLEALGSVVSFSGHLVKASRDIQGRHPEMALLLNQVASRLDSWQIKLQERVVAQKIEDWQVRLGHFETRSGDSVYALSKRIEDLSNVNKEYNFCDKLQGAPITTASSLFKIGTRSSFQAALEVLDKIPATAQKVIPFEEAAKNLPKDLSKEEFTAFLKAWEQVLDQASGALSEVNFVENIGRTNLNNTIQKTLAFKSRFPPSFHLTQLHSQQRLLMAKTLVERPETALKKRGRKIIANLSSTTEEYFNQRDYISHRHFVHGVRPSGWSIYQLNFFSPIDFKLAALVEISKVDSQNKAAYLKEAYELSKQVNLNPETESLHDFENKFYHQWLLAEALYKNNFTDEARELRTRMSSSCLSAERAHTKRVQDFDRMPEVKRDQDFNKKWALKSESESIKFWLQYLDSKMKANEALQLSRQGSTELAQNVASELVTAFANDVKQRRNRFDVHSMIQTAVSLAESPTLRELSIKALKVCHEKLALLRGDKEVFNNGIVYFMDQLKSSHLSLENQDTLLTELVKGLVPKSEGVNLDWKVVLDSGVPLLKVVESISETGLYPKAELESLRIVSKLTEKIHFNHDLGKYGNRAAIETLRKLFDEIALRHPELFRESNLITLQNLSGQTSHRKALTHLFPNVDQVSTSKPLVVEGKIDMLRLETGKFDRSQASVEVGRELRVAFVENNEARLRNALTAYEVLLDFDLAQLRAQNPNQKFLELSEIKGSSAFKDLESLLEAKLGRSDSHFDNRELAVLKTLFGARTQEVATSS